MCTGKYSLNLYGITADGWFTDGKITFGRVCVGGFIYDGGFDSDTLLHGYNCTAEKDRIRCVGQFIHGQFVEGKIYRDNVLIKKGKFITRDSFYILEEGWKLCADQSEEYGVFDTNEVLIRGSRIDAIGVTYDITDCREQPAVIKNIILLD